MSLLQGLEVDELDSVVEAFETAWLDGNAVRLGQFLPSSSHPRYWEIVAELARVDMELRSDKGELRGVDSYCTLIPGLSSNTQALERIAYEEYRLRVARGEQASREEYARKYRIPTENWSRFVALGSSSSERSDHSLIETSVPTAWSNALELTDEIAEFPECPAEFAGFFLEREIGRGAFARVYLARQGQLADRLVVLKVAAGISVEPQHLARLQHTHIVPIYSVHKVGRLTAVCMPYLGRRTLAEFLTERKTRTIAPDSGQVFLSTLKANADTTCIELSPTRPETFPTANPLVGGLPRTSANEIGNSSYTEAVTRIVQQIADGLRHAHQRGIVHRDLKPANILLTDEGSALILDFNLSTEVVVNGPVALAVGGTLPYMAPEHLEALISGSRVDFCSDIFSLGVVYFELLTGEKPFPNRKGSLENVVAQMLSDRRSAHSINRLPAALDSDVAAVILRCLAPRVEDRYQSIEELYDDLSRHLANLPLRHAPNTSLLRRCQKWSRRHPRLSSASVVTGLAAVLLAAVGWFALRLTAENSYQQFVTKLPTARAALSIAEDDPALLREGIDQVESLLRTYGVSSDASWKHPLSSWGLKSAERVTFKHGLSDLSYQIADTYSRLAFLENDPNLTSKATAWNNLALSLVTSAPPPLQYENQHFELQQKASGTTPAQVTDRKQDVLQRVGTADGLLAARQLVFSGDFSLAVPCLLKLRNETPQDPVIWLLLGDAYAGLGELARADECFSTAIALLPQSYLALYNRGRCRSDLRQFELAIDDFTAALTLKPDFPACLLNRALAQAAVGNHAEAIKDYTTALDRGAPYTRIYFLRARSHVSLGNLAEAAQDRAIGLELEPRDEESWIARGVARLPNDPIGALSDFERALELNPRSISALQNIVHVNAEILGQEDKAFAALDAILLISPNNPDALAGRGVLYARQGKTAQASTDVGTLLRNSSHPKHLFQAACALSLISDNSQGAAHRALQLLARSIALDPRLGRRAETDPDLQNIRKLDEYQSLRISPEHDGQQKSEK